MAGKPSAVAHARASAHLEEPGAAPSLAARAARDKKDAPMDAVGVYWLLAGKPKRESWTIGRNS